MAGTASEVFVMTTGEVSIKSPYNSGSYVPMGFSKNGYAFSGDNDIRDVMVDEKIRPIKRNLRKAVRVATVQLAQATLANLAYAIPGCSLSGSTITYGDTDVLPEVAFKYIGTDDEGNTHTIEFTKATITSASGEGTNYSREEDGIFTTIVVAELEPDSGSDNTQTFA